MTKYQGTSLIEVMLALLLINIMLVAVLRLMLANLRHNSQAQQLAGLALNNIAQRLRTNLQDGNIQDYQEISYSSNSTLAINCAASKCTPQQLAHYDLYQWKQYLISLNIPSLRGIVCADDSYTIPSLTNPNCSGRGMLLIKLVWLSESNTNYLVLPIARLSN